MRDELLSRLHDGSAVIGVIGLGYVGLPLALGFAKNYRVFGFDIRPELIQELRRGEARDHGIPREEMIAALDSRFMPTADFGRLQECDFIIIAVGTPLTEGHDPDLSQVEAAAREIARRMRPNQFIVLESTSFPGTTEEVLLPILESSGYRLGIDFGLAFSPERIDPGNRAFRLEGIPKLVGGLDATSTDIATELYRQVIRTVIPVSHAKVAEAAKILENLFRAVNIALVNEVALILERLDIDAWEAIEAAASKPFGYMPFYPGPGVGGHCIPLDPYYLSYRARRAGYLPRFIELSGDLNEYMQFHAVELLRRGLEEAGRRPSSTTVAVLGLAFKRDVADTRESPSVRVIDECLREGMKVRVYDPHAPSITTRSGTLLSEVDVESAVAGAEAAILLVDHEEFIRYDYEHLTALMPAPAVWVDMRHILATAPKGSITLGVGRPSGRVPSTRGTAAGGTQPVVPAPERSDPSDER